MHHASGFMTVLVMTMTYVYQSIMTILLYVHLIFDLQRKQPGAEPEQEQEPEQDMEELQELQVGLHALFTTY